MKLNKKFVAVSKCELCGQLSKLIVRIAIRLCDSTCFTSEMLSELSATFSLEKISHN